MSFERAEVLDQLWSGEMTGVTIHGQRVLLVRVEDEVYAYEDRCAHQNVPLSEGSLLGCELVCRAHLWKFDACSGKGINPTGTHLKRFPVRIDKNEIYVDVENANAEAR